MRALKLLTRLLRVGWFWAFVLLALPNCGLPTSDGTFCENENCDDGNGGDDGDGPCDPELGECPDPPDPPKIFDRGDSPEDAIFCDFPKPLGPGESDCATAQEALDGMSTAYAAVALVQGQTNAIALDFSPAAVAACGGPRRTYFLEGSYPFGSHVCINCGTQIDGNPYASLAEACIAQCTDLINFGGGTIPTEGAAAYCQVHAKTSTNTDPEICYPGACTGGNANPAWVDPRIHQEPVVWIDQSPGVDEFSANGTTSNSLRRTSATTGPADSDFNEGAASAQTISGGDAWVEFAAGEPSVSHVVSLRESCADPAGCADTSFNLDEIGYAISLNNDNQVYVLEKTGSTTLAFFGPFGAYAPHERFRVRATDNNDGITNTISYSRVDPGCMDGTVCGETVFYTHVGSITSYPLRVDSTFREVDATIENVTMVYIKQQ